MLWVRPDVLLCVRCTGQNRDDIRRRQVLTDAACALGMSEQCCHGFVHSPADLWVRAANRADVGPRVSQCNGEPMFGR